MTYTLLLIALSLLFAAGLSFLLISVLRWMRQSQQETSLFLQTLIGQSQSTNLTSLQTLRDSMESTSKQSQSFQRELLEKTISGLSSGQKDLAKVLTTTTNLLASKDPMAFGQISSVTSPLDADTEGHEPYTAADDTEREKLREEAAQAVKDAEKFFEGLGVKTDGGYFGTAAEGLGEDQL